MVMAIAFDDARADQVRHEGDGKGMIKGVFDTRFFGSSENPHLPHAGLNQVDPGYSSSTHFHTHDQFQVVVDGKGTLGRHEISPYTVHFTRAYTPYGPLVSDTVRPLTFFVMRTRYDSGSQ